MEWRIWSSVTVQRQLQKKVPETVSPEKKQEIIDELKLKTQHINGISKNQKIHNKLIQRHLQRRMINKYLKEYLKKDIYLQKKDKIENLIFNIVV